MRYIFWMTVVSTCLLGATVDSVLLSQYERWWKERHRPRHDPSKSDKSERAKIHNPGRVARKFVPNGNRCCKVGEKSAKKKLSCSSVGIYAAARKFNNSVHKAKIVMHPKGRKKYAKVLTAKINKCSANFSKRFEKCCKTKAEYYRHMKKCRRLRRSERKRCRELIKSRYRS